MGCEHLNRRSRPRLGPRRAEMLKLGSWVSHEEAAGWHLWFSRGQ